MTLTPTSTYDLDPVKQPLDLLGLLFNKNIKNQVWWCFEKNHQMTMFPLIYFTSEFLSNVKLKNMISTYTKFLTYWWEHILVLIFFEMTRDITPTLHKWEALTFWNSKFQHMHTIMMHFSQRKWEDKCKNFIANHNHTWSSTYKKAILGFVYQPKQTPLQ
jgi:hypothetical protein